MAIKDKDQAGVGTRILGVDSLGLHVALPVPIFAPATDFTAFIASLGSVTSYHVIVARAVTMTGVTAVPKNIWIEVQKGGVINRAGFALSLYGFNAGRHLAFSGTGVVTFNEGVAGACLEWWGGANDNSTNNSTAIEDYLACFAASNFVLHLSEGIYRYGSTINLNDLHNGIFISGEGVFSSTLMYTGVGDGISMGNNINGLNFINFRLYSTTGRDAISITAGAATAIPDAGVMLLSRIDIRGWLRHAIKGRLTVNVRTEMLQVVLNGGCGLYVENANPYRATTWMDTGSWFHENGGHGIALKGTFTFTLSGTISDSNTGLSTDVDTISCAGYTLIGGGAWTPCVDTDIGKVVTQGGISVGTLAHYDNTDQHMVINCTTAPSGTGALAITSGTGASASSTFRKNSHGLYAARSAYLNVNGGHFENHLYGIFLDSIYDSYIAPGYILTQGTGAYGFYAAGVCQRIAIPILGVDVQAGGIAAAYKGPLCIGVNWYKPGAYTTVDRSANSFNVDTQNAGSTLVDIKSTGANPFSSETSDRSVGVFSGTHDTDSDFGVNNSGGASARTIISLRKSGTKLVSWFCDNAINAFGFLASSNVMALFDRNTANSPDVVQVNTAGNMYMAGQGQSGPMVFEGSSPNADASGASMAEYSGSAPLNNGVKSITRIKKLTMGAVANERGGKFSFLTRTSGASGAETERAALDETGLNLTVGIQIPAGGSVEFSRVPGVWKSSVASVGTALTAETDLQSFTVPANMLSGDGDSLEFVAFGTFGANANGKRVKAYFGATTIINPGSIAFNNSQWSLRGTITRINSTSQITTVTFATNDALTYVYTQYGTPGETLSGAVVFRVTGTGTANNDIVCTGAKVLWHPAP